MILSDPRYIDPELINGYAKLGYTIWVLGRVPEAQRAKVAAITEDVPTLANWADTAIDGRIRAALQLDPAHVKAASPKIVILASEYVLTLDRKHWNALENAMKTGRAVNVLVDITHNYPAPQPTTPAADQLLAKRELILRLVRELLNSAEAAFGEPPAASGNAAEDAKRRADLMFNLWLFCVSTDHLATLARWSDLTGVIYREVMSTRDAAKAAEQATTEHHNRKDQTT